MPAFAAFANHLGASAHRDRNKLENGLSNNCACGYMK